MTVCWRYAPTCSPQTMGSYPCIQQGSATCYCHSQEGCKEGQGALKAPMHQASRELVAKQGPVQAPVDTHTSPHVPDPEYSGPRYLLTHRLHANTTAFVSRHACAIICLCTSSTRNLRRLEKVTGKAALCSHCVTYRPF